MQRLDRFRLDAEFGEYAEEGCPLTVPLCVINGRMFLVVRNRLDLNNLNLELPDVNIILLAPIAAGENIDIKSHTVVLLSHLTAPAGKITIHPIVYAVGINNILESRSMVLKRGCYLRRSESFYQRIFDDFNQGMTERDVAKFANGLNEVFKLYLDYHRRDGVRTTDEVYSNFLDFFKISLRNDDDDDSESVWEDVSDSDSSNT